MNTTLAKLLEKLTPAEQAEVETFAAFLLVRRSGETILARPYSEDFGKLEARKDYTYSMSMRDPAQGRSILELKGLGKEIWKDVDAQEHVDRERGSWHG